jgi:hydrogenase nickel incorporation protein HypA/HybF
MHELSIAQSVLEIAQASIPAPFDQKVRSIKVQIGRLSGVVPDSLEFCFMAIAQGTPLQGALLEMEQIPFIFKCRSCGASTESEVGIVVCDSCGGVDTEVLSGTELRVVEIELQEEVNSEELPS